jgi:hypothetical protein
MPSPTGVVAAGVDGVALYANDVLAAAKRAAAEDA